MFLVFFFFAHLQYFFFVVRFESLAADIAELHGLTEELKAGDQMKWVQIANYIVNKAKKSLTARRSTYGKRDY